MAVGNTAGIPKFIKDILQAKNTMRGKLDRLADGVEKPT
jgi:hypothetical protein